MQIIDPEQPAAGQSLDATVLKQTGACILPPRLGSTWQILCFIPLLFVDVCGEFLETSFLTSDTSLLPLVFVPRLHCFGEFFFLIINHFQP